MRSNLVDIDVQLLRETEKAVLVTDSLPEKAVWLPRSEIEIEQNAAFPGIHTVTMPEWLAMDKGLI